MEWRAVAFDAMTGFDVYRILRARSEVFVVEQNCLYLDADKLDYLSTHIFAEDGDEIAAYCRITPKGTRFSEISIGRVITTKNYRRIGLGRELMRRAIDAISNDMGERNIRISAQAYLRNFYEGLGFRVVSDTYLEDDIPHYEMLRSE